MGEIFVEGIGSVQIAGDAPTPEEAAAIAGGVPEAPPPASAMLPSPREVAVRDEGQLTGTIDQALRLRDAERRSPLDVAMEQGGVSGEGAPPSARLAEGFGNDPRKTVEAGLRNVYGKKVETRMGGDTGRLEFKNPLNGKWTLVNPPGVDLGDIASLAGEALVATGETAGGVAGSAVSPVVGTTAGIAGGAFIGELARLSIGKKMGVHDMSDDDMIREAGIRAGIAGVGGIVFERLVKLGQVFLAGSVSGVSEKTAVKAAKEKAGELSSQVRGVTGKDFPQTSGQALNDPDMLGAESNVSRRPGGESVTSVLREQKDVLKDIEDEIQAPFVASRSDEGIAEDIQSVARRGPNKGKQTAAEQTEAARKTAESEFQRVQNNLISTRGEITTEEASVLAREAIQTGRDTVRDRLKARYANLNAEAGDAVVNLGPFRETAQKWKKTLDDDILPSLVEEDQRLVSEAVSGENASFSSVQRALSALRTELRLARKGVSARKDVGAIQELHDSLLISRNKALESRPDLKKMIDDLEASYARSKELIDRSMIGDIIKKKEGGGYVLRDDLVIKRILQNPSGAKQIASVISDPQYSSFLDAREPIRRGILAEYRRTVLDPETGIANPAKHATFMRNNVGSMRHFFNSEELSMMNRPGRASVMLREMEKREKEIVAKIDKSFGVKLNNYDSSELINKTWAPTKLETVRKLKVMLKNDPEKWAGYQAGAMRKLWSSISSYDKGAEAFRVNVGRLAGALDDSGMVTLMRDTFGQKTVDNLRVLSDALKVASREGGGDLVSTVSGKGEASALRHILRAHVGMFTTRGRVMTAALKIRGKAAERSLIKALSDINELDRLVSLRYVSPDSMKARVILGGLGATILSEPAEQ